DEEVAIGEGVEEIEGAALQVARIVAAKLVFERAPLRSAREDRTVFAATLAEFLVADIIVEGLGADEEAVLVPLDVGFGNHLHRRRDEFAALDVDVAIVRVHVVVRSAGRDTAAVIDGDEFAAL